VNPPGSGPIVIAGVGGSGTRIVAEIVRDLDVYLGADLNRSSDNLWATLLLRRPKWYLESRSDGGAVERALTVLEGAMNGRLEADADVEDLVTGAGRELRDQGLSEEWTRARIESLLGHGRSGTSWTRWGWKEPNSHIYLDSIGRHFADARYVHVIRHGLDMAFSPNQWQARTWGWLFDVTVGDQVDPATSLDYWLRANRAAVDTATRSFGQRFLLVDYDALCQNPAREASRIASFVGGELSSPQSAGISEMVGARCTSGRWRRFGTGPFRRDQLAQVEAFGFDIR
jgi:Sulfotransferase family